MSDKQNYSSQDSEEPNEDKDNWAAPAASVIEHAQEHPLVGRPARPREERDE